MQTHLKRALMILAAAVIVLLLMPRGVTSQTPAANNASMVSEKIAATSGTANSASATKTDAELPSLKEILDRAEKAVGGEEAWKSVNTRLMKGVYQSEDSSAFVAMEIYQKSPDKTLYKMKLPQDIVMRDVCDGKSAWIEDPRGGYHEYSGAALASRVRRSQFSEQANMILIAATGKVLGVEKAGAHNAYVVEYSPQKNETAKLYFDTESGLEIRTEDTFQSSEGPYVVKLDMDDYREVDGMKFPFRMKRTEKGAVINIRLTQVKNNYPIEDELFAKPVSAPKQ
jgi:outer membrane lipoprotein-sorting protein